jgi:hypothetical protein
VIEPAAASAAASRVPAREMAGGAGWDLGRSVRVCESLETRGCWVWVDSIRIQLGIDWAKRLRFRLEAHCIGPVSIGPVCSASSSS